MIDNETTISARSLRTPASVPLVALALSRTAVPLVLMSIGRCSALAILLALWIPLPLAAQPAGRPNILLLMAEDMSTRVGAYGDPVAGTPHLDALAGEGVRYTNVFTTAGVCAPSRAAHILGVHQIATGTQHMRTRGGPHGTYQSVPPARIKAYPELLRAAGYYTFTDAKLDYQFSGPLADSGPFTVWNDEGRGTDWRARRDGQPFFGLLNFQVTHESGVFAPLGAMPHSLMHFVIQVARAVQAPDVPAPAEVAPRDLVLPPYYPDTPTVRTDVARHYTNIATMDAEVGALLERLEADGLADSTIVIWTTDHGDGLPRGKRELFDSGIHVPLIIRWPAAFRPEGVAPGSVETRLVSLIDLAPTLLRLAGVPRPDYLHGTDFVRGSPREYIYAARDRIDEVPDRQRAVRDARYKYIRSWYPQTPGGHPLAFRDNIDMVRELRELFVAGELDAAQRQWFEPPGEERLFDTARDPFELDDLSDDPAHAQVLARMRGALEDWLAATGDWSEMSEADMIERFWPGGEQPVTPPPEFELRADRLAITAPAEASIGYRIGKGPWRIYSAPISVERGASVTAKAVRYGWKESDAVAFKRH